MEELMNEAYKKMLDSINKLKWYYNCEDLLKVITQLKCKFACWEPERKAAVVERLGISCLIPPQRQSTCHGTSLIGCLFL